jgi:hypothetical protein
MGKLRLLWEGPFAVTARPSPKARTLALPRKVRCSPTANADRLQPSRARADGPPAPGPVSDPGQEGEREAERLLHRKDSEIRGVLRYLVRRRGHTSADGEWLRAEEPAHRTERVAEYDAAAPRRRRARLGRNAGAPAVPLGVAVAVAAPQVAPAGFRFAAAAEVLAGAALVGRSILYRWPVQGWVLGKVVRVSRAVGFSHVVRYARGSALGVGEAASFLDAPSHRGSPGPAGRWFNATPPGLALSLTGRP